MAIPKKGSRKIGLGWKLEQKGNAFKYVHESKT